MYVVYRFLFRTRPDIQVWWITWHGNISSNCRSSILSMHLLSQFQPLTISVNSISILKATTIYQKKILLSWQNEELKRLSIKYLTMMLKQYLLRNAQNCRGVGLVVRWFLQLRTKSGMLKGESLMLLLGRDILATQVVKNLELQLTKLVYYNETGCYASGWLEFCIYIHNYHVEIFLILNQPFLSKLV